MSGVKIGSNIASLMAQRRLGESSDMLVRSYERLSSGMRINRASDDAAGLAIAQDLKVSSRINTQALRNVNDAVSFLNVAQGGIEALSTITTRIMELAEQSANGTYSTQQRQALNTEAQSLLSEYTRIIEGTKFNNRTLLDGNFQNVAIQVGTANTANDRIVLNINNLLTLQASSTSTQPTGTFQDGVSYNGNNTFGHMDTADINGDGFLDLITNSPGVNTKIFITLSNGDGTFKAATSLPNPGVIIGNVQAADLNEDGHLDLIGNDYSTNKAMIYYGNGNATFKAAVSFNGAGTPFNFGSVGDINNDGHLDLVGENGWLNGGHMIVFTGNGNGTFNAVFTGTSQFYSVVGHVGDINHDGYDDVLALDNNTVMYAFLGNSDGTLKARVSYRAGSRYASFQELAIGDVNGDGELDVVYPAGSGTGADRGINVIFGNSNGTFKAPVSYGGLNNFYDAKISDVNNDGVQDIIATNLTTDTIDILLGNGNGTFKAATTYANGQNPYMLEVADFTGDGVNDIIVSNSGEFGNDRTVLYIANTTQTTSTTGTTISLLTQSLSQSALDTLRTNLETISQELGQIGAQMSRLQIADNRIRQLREAQEAAYSRIMDVDVAEETSQLIRNQILQKSATSILGQANLQSDLVLKLLK